MTLLVVMAVGLAGGIGAMARFLLDGAVSSRVASPFPLGTFVVNVSGALLLGLFVGLAASHDAMRLAGTGAIGAYTTLSTWMLESHRLAEEGQGRIAAANIAVSLLAGVLAVWAGRKLGGAL
jgi:CrcB protein